MQDEFDEACEGESEAPESDEHFRPVPCVHGHFPHIPFPHPPPLGAAYKPPETKAPRPAPVEPSAAESEASLAWRAGRGSGPRGRI